MSHPPVIEVRAEDTHELRRRVLRTGTASTDVHLDMDDDKRCLHLGIKIDAMLVACVTFAPQPPPHDPGDGAMPWRFRAMAVDSAMQGGGLGRTLLLAGFDHVRAMGATHVWANARDTAVGFYVTLGMRVIGDGFVDAATGLPHHVVAIDLA